MAYGWSVSVLALIYVFLMWRSHLRTKRMHRKRRNRDWAAPFVELLGWTGLFGYLQPVLQRPKMWLAVMEGGACTPDRLLRWTAEGVGMGYAALSAGWLFAYLSGNPLIGWLGMLVGGSIPALRARDLNRRVERRRQILILELPVLLSRLLVLVNAGENVWRALARCAENRAEWKHPLYEELFSALAAMQRGESMSLAMEEFGRRCAIPEAKLFAAVLLMNAKRGGEEFVPALRDLTRQMWDKRKSAARTLGEQASSRMAFPLALIFLLIIVLVGAPTMLSM